LNFRIPSAKALGYFQRTEATGAVSPWAKGGRRKSRGGMSEIKVEWSRWEPRDMDEAHRVSKRERTNQKEGE
jgi:hypothetical protein